MEARKRAMKLATWNVNSVRVRMPHILRWLNEASPDVLCLQETKATDEAFPAEEIRKAGYEVVFAGQKTYNGVAILSRERPTEVEIGGLPGEGLDDEKRLISARVRGLDVINVYVPNGMAVGSKKYAYKLAWLESLGRYLETKHDISRPLVLCGDFNIAPEDIDVHDADAVRGSIMFSQEEHDALQGLLLWGLEDSLRLCTRDKGLYSWWDYRSGAFRRNLGWRIDLILVSRPLVASCTAAWIDVEPRGWERPSDHTPVLLELGEA